MDVQQLTPQASFAENAFSSSGLDRTFPVVLALYDNHLCWVSKFDRRATVCIDQSEHIAATMRSLHLFGGDRGSCC